MRNTKLPKIKMRVNIVTENDCISLFKVVTVIFLTTMIQKNVMSIAVEFVYMILLFNLQLKLHHLKKLLVL